MWMFYSYDYVRHQWWVSMVVYGWEGGFHIMDDFGNLVQVPSNPTTRSFGLNTSDRG